LQIQLLVLSACIADNFCEPVDSSDFSAFDTSLRQVWQTVRPIGKKLGASRAGSR